MDVPTMTEGEDMTALEASTVGDTCVPDRDPEWALRTLAATLADTVDAYEAVLWLARDRDIEWDDAPAAVLRGLDHAEAWDAERRAVGLGRPTETCPRCRGGGTHPDHDRGCPGGGPICEAQCPVEVRCDLCRATGLVTPEVIASLAKQEDIDEPF